MYAAPLVENNGSGVQVPGVAFWGLAIFHSLLPPTLYPWTVILAVIQMITWT
jgi:hypothetical protein